AGSPELIDDALIHETMTHDEDKVRPHPRLAYATFQPQARSPNQGYCEVTPINDRQSLVTAR
ncbi:MAG: hypothetical protein WCJ09_20625, partial [Planctomycetota bacterium]